LPLSSDRPESSPYFRLLEQTQGREYKPNYTETICGRRMEEECSLRNSVLNKKLISSRRQSTVSNPLLYKKVPGHWIMSKILLTVNVPQSRIF
jgi:hypothetical protein